MKRWFLKLGNRSIINFVARYFHLFLSKSQIRHINMRKNYSWRWDWHYLEFIWGRLVEKSQNVPKQPFTLSQSGLQVAPNYLATASSYCIWSPGVLEFFWDLDSDHAKSNGWFSIKDMGKKAACFLGVTQTSLRKNCMSGEHGVNSGTINGIGKRAFWKKD